MVTAVSNAASAQASTSAAAAQTSTSALTSDFETFLNMMTTQAKYQDPLEPMDSSDYTAQLAQFSSVEQQVLTNDNLSSIMSQLNLSNMSQLTGWVGKDVRAQAAASFDGSTPVVVSPNPAADSDHVQLVVFNEDNTEIARADLPVSAEPYEWDGRDADGDLLPAGNYSFRVQSFDSEDFMILDDMAEVYGRVEETQTIDNQVVLIMESGSAILATSVTALRDPDSDNS